MGESASGLAQFRPSSSADMLAVLIVAGTARGGREAIRFSYGHRTRI